jgi:hypothetical protein
MANIDQRFQTFHELNIQTWMRKVCRLTSLPLAPRALASYHPARAFYDKHPSAFRTRPARKRQNHVCL